VWRSDVGGERLKFRLVGINNQNFIMADDRTGTWWQQVSGKAILGPMTGAQLTPVPADIVSFDTWRAEHPSGRVLAPDPAVEQRDGDYLPPTWEREMASMKTVTPLPKGSPFEARQLVVGVKVGDLAKAWSLDDLRKAQVQLDQLGDVPLMIVVARDGKSVRVFDRRLDGRELEFVAPLWGGASAVQVEGSPEGPPHGRRFVDVETGSTWDFAGRAISGALAGRTLTRVEHLLEYWFDWQTYQPRTLVHRSWNPVTPKPDRLTVPKPKG
jgi:hypothetical protein